MKKLVLVILSFVAAQVFAVQFTNIYKTKAVCTEVDNIEYCYITVKEDVFAVMNYQEMAGRIVFHGKDYPEYVPTGNATQEENSKGVSVWQNDYKNLATGKEYLIMYSNDNLWLSSDWNGNVFCHVTKYWRGDKDSFQETYQFKEVYSSERLESLSRRCYGKGK